MSHRRCPFASSSFALAHDHSDLPSPADLASPAEAGFAKAGSRYPTFAIML